MCRLDRESKLDDAPQKKKQKVGIGLLRDKLYEQDFAGPVSVRASKVLGPIRRCRVADILPRMKPVSRASRPGLIVGVLLYHVGDRVPCFHGETISNLDSW